MNLIENLDNSQIEKVLLAGIIVKKKKPAILYLLAFHFYA